MVFFSITIESDDDDDLWDDGLEETITAEEIYEMKIEDIKVCKEGIGNFVVV